MKLKDVRDFMAIYSYLPESMLVDHLAKLLKLMDLGGGEWVEGGCRFYPEEFS